MIGYLILSRSQESDFGRYAAQKSFATETSQVKVVKTTKGANSIDLYIFPGFFPHLLQNIVKSAPEIQ
jgi:hypothetical protein